MLRRVLSNDLAASSPNQGQPTSSLLFAPNGHAAGMEPEPNKKLTAGEVFALLLFGLPLGAIVLVGIGSVVKAAVA